jgi:Acyl-coenzyme A:6-aminopenicillanic acid acyl-transferase
VSLRVVHAEGDARARGRAIGEALGDLIDRSLGFYRGYLEGQGIRDLERALAPYWDAAERAFPAHAGTIAATAAAAGVPTYELFAVNACEELETLPAPTTAAVERCSSFTAVAPGTTLLAHNEQWFAGDAGNIAVVVEHPAEGVAVASPTVACCLPAVGMNAYGAAQGIDSLTAKDDGVGIPRVLVSRHALEAEDREDAVRRAGSAGRAGGYGHVFAFAGGDAFTVETTGERLAVLDGPGPHTNHYISPDLQEIGDEPAAGSVSRYERLVARLRDQAPRTPNEAMDLLRDHDSSPQAVCKHATPGADEESTVVFSTVCELESRRMWVAPGNPCEHAYEEVDLGL